MPIEPFRSTLAQQGLQIQRQQPTTVQMNIGKLCNQACLHCHVEAGPKRTELMTLETMSRLLQLIDDTSTVTTADITGGAPELNPHFRWLIEQLRQRDIRCIDRCNLTVLFEQGQETTAQFLRDHEVHIVASLPCYSRDNVDRQRGRGVFDASIRALTLFNELGYGVQGSNLQLDLVYNPVDLSLPPAQQTLEQDYKQELRELFGIEFNQLLTITNMPIKRFLQDLHRRGKYQEYMELLIQSFNPTTIDGLMCRSLVSVGWDGLLFDCDFNQMLELGLSGRHKTIWDVRSFDQLMSESIVLGNHCYGCTAGAGSSCGGALA